MGDLSYIDGLTTAKALLATAREAAEADGDGNTARGYRLALREMRRLINNAIAEASRTRGQ